RGNWRQRVARLAAACPRDSAPARLAVGHEPAAARGSPPPARGLRRTDDEEADDAESRSARGGRRSRAGRGAAVQTGREGIGSPDAQTAAAGAPRDCGGAIARQVQQDPPPLRYA